MSAALYLALAVSHGIVFACGAWAHFLWGHHLKHSQSPTISPRIR
jgi:hypothetical protein